MTETTGTRELLPGEQAIECDDGFQDVPSDEYP